MLHLASAPTAAARPQARPMAARHSAARQPAVQHAAAPRRPCLQRCRAAAEAEAGAQEQQQQQPQPQEAPVQPSAEAVQQAASRAAKPKMMTAAWEQAISWKQQGTTLEAKVTSANRSGLLVNLGTLTGFLPYKLLDPSRLTERSADSGRFVVPANGHQQLVGTDLKVKVTQVVVPEKRLIVSEKAVLLEDLAAVVAPGDVVEGVVGTIMDWGAFVECRSVNGQPCPRAEAVLPLRELSYAWVASPAEVLRSGQPVRVSVLFVQTDPAAKVVVSLKRLEDDPLKETLDKVLPLNDNRGASYNVDEVPAAVPHGVDEILEALSREEGVEAVSLGRSVEEKRTVSQDLELWITKEQLDNGFNLAVRAGRMVQEVHVTTRMSPDEMRAAVQRVLRSIN